MSLKDHMDLKRPENRFLPLPLDGMRGYSTPSR
jgi:hypothetical protein